MRHTGYIWIGMICVALMGCKAKKSPAAATHTDAQLEGISSMLPDNKVDRTDEGIRIVFNSAILFNVNSSILTDKAKVAIERLASALRDNTGVIQVNGYTDSSGTAEYNVWLSERRAAAVKTHLETLGLRASEIRVKGYGAANPVDTNATPEGREQNRRVEVIVASAR